MGISNNLVPRVFLGWRKYLFSKGVRERNYSLEIELLLSEGNLVPSADFPIRYGTAKGGWGCLFKWQYS